MCSGIWDVDRTYRKIEGGDETIFMVYVNQKDARRKEKEIEDQPNHDNSVLKGSVFMTLQRTVKLQRCEWERTRHERNLG